MAPMIGLCTIASSQKRLDSSVVAIKDLRKAAILIEQGKACIEENKLLNKQVDLLGERLKLKDTIRVAYQLQIDLRDSIIASLKKNEVVFRGEIKEIEKQYRREIKKQKLKSYGIGAIGLTLLYLLIK